MIAYNTKEWLAVFQLHKADTFRKLLPFIVFVAAFTWLVAFLEKEYFHLTEGHPLENITVMHSLIGFALAMLLVFRTNTAYDRWWEGRKLWGSLVNNSRNLAMKLAALLPDDANERTFFASAIPRFAVELMTHLRAAATRLELDEKPHPEIPDFDTSRHVPAQVAGLIAKRLQKLRSAGAVTSEDLLIMNPELISLLDICGACERIRNTPIPYSYNVFIKKFIVVYVLTLPFGIAFSLSYYAVAVVSLIFYLLASLELIAEEIEEPFGTDFNDLPMDRLCHTINKTVREILE
jgi:putative membrane protein